MKKINLSFIYLCGLLCISSIIGVSCSGGGNHQHKSEEHAAHHDAPKTEQKTTPKVEATNLLNSYFVLKEALVETNAKSAQEAANKLGSFAEGELKTLAENLAGTEDVEKQREIFNTVSQQVYEQVKGTEDNKAAVYKQFCPMAFEYKGAFWLSNSEEIRNPYFGDKMLHCGEVKETIAAQ